MIGRAWFGAEFEEDPVWRMLARLAGRLDCDAPGADRDAPDDWTISSDWLAPWGKATHVHYNATRKRLRLWHTCGFVLFDVPRDSQKSPLAQAHELCATVAWLRTATLLRATPTGAYPRRKSTWQSWMGYFMPYLSARLALALHLNEGDVNGSTLVCRHSAELQCSSSTLDVRLSLATLPLPIRAAGLDRDPGWIPAAGRSLVFHFE
jgi:hypothetical protein